MSAGGKLTRETLFLAQNYIQMRKRPSFDYFYFRHGYVDLWWGRKRRNEWAPHLYSKWRYHYNTYIDIVQNWSKHRVDSLYQTNINYIKSLLPTFTHSLVNWLATTDVFKQLVSWTTKVLEFVDSSTTTFKSKFKSFWGSPANINTPKRFVRWFFGKQRREILVSKKVSRSLNLKTKKPSKLVNDLNKFYQTQGR